MKKWDARGGRKKLSRKKRELIAWRCRRAVFNGRSTRKMLNYIQRSGDPLI